MWWTDRQGKSWGGGSMADPGLSGNGGGWRASIALDLKAVAGRRRAELIAHARRALSCLGRGRSECESGRLSVSDCQQLGYPWPCLRAAFLSPGPSNRCPADNRVIDANGVVL